jgi:ubiquinone/menaquinone biosynthesis C-methylase UbiE
MNPRILSEEIVKFYPPDYGPHQSKPGQRREDRRIIKAELKKKPLSGIIRDTLRGDSRLLDVGCGNADFLYAMKTMTGCSVYGVDNSKVAAKTAKGNYGIDIFAGTILECPYPDDYFDVITAWWCLEHVPNPSEVLRKMCSLLKQDGYCIIGIPNIDSFVARTFKDKWYHLDCPRHLHIYSPGSITRLLDKTGFEVVKKIFDKTPWGLFRSLRYYFGDEDIPLKHRKRFKGSSLLKRLLLPWTILLALLGQSDIMVVYARKKKTI